jgi:hypothetical protein
MSAQVNMFRTKHKTFSDSRLSKMGIGLPSGRWLLQRLGAFMPDYLVPTPTTEHSP